MNDIQGSYNTAAADYHEVLKDNLQVNPRDAPMPPEKEPQGYLLVRKPA
ncbi:hypothetical protein ACXC9Q_03770 [Kribbella sp. CWNU-51]